jgi:hypothetical protein
MQRLEVSGAVRPIYGSLGVKRLRKIRAISLLPLWAVLPVQSLSACTRVHLYLLVTFNIIQTDTFVTTGRT